jgi:hypothetical protein
MSASFASIESRAVVASPCGVPRTRAVGRITNGAPTSRRRRPRRDVDRPCSGTRDRFLACFSTRNRTVCVTRNVDEEPRWTSIIEMGEMGDLVVEYGGTPRGRG